MVLRAITDHLGSTFPDVTFSYAGANLLDAIETISAHNPTCAIVDLDLGDGRTPAQIVTALRDEEIPVVMISAHEQALLVQEAMVAGASAYVPKRAIIDQLAQAVTAAESQTTWLSPDFAAVLVPVEGSTVVLEPLAERALVLFAAGLPSPMIASRTGVAVDEVAPLLDSALRAYRFAAK